MLQQLRRLPMNRNKLNKLLCTFFLTLFLYLALIFFYNPVTKNYETQFVNSNKRQNISGVSSKNILNKDSELKYMLLWTKSHDSPFVYFGTGQSVFLSKNCKYTNCYVTDDRNYLGHYSEFEAILFNGPRLAEILLANDIPMRRNLHQKYVYANIEAAANYPVEPNVWNGFFNWTWTYRLDSECQWGYIVIRNITGHIVGPSIYMQWLPFYKMAPIDDELKRKLETKTKAAVWFNSNCYTLSRREVLAMSIQNELKHYGLQLHIYGSCGKFECPKETMKHCLKIIEKDYYFFFAFENALSEDYVTEKILYAINSYTIPIVFGGANYSRFMPDGIYLDASKTKPQELAKRMYEIIKSPRLHHNFFRWKKYYSYHFRHESQETDDYCDFCAILNDQRVITTTVYDNFDVWWNTNTTTEEY